jgi:hypothetical protein
LNGAALSGRCAAHQKVGLSDRDALHAQQRISHCHVHDIWISGDSIPI